MNIEQEITAYLNANYEKHKDDIIEVLCKFLGEEHRKINTDKVNSLGIVYFVNRKWLKSCLRSEDLDDSECKLLEYFLDKMDNAEEINFDNMNIKELIAYLDKKDLKPSLRLALECAKKIVALSEDIGDLEEYEGLKEAENALRLCYKKTQNIGPNYYIIGTYGYNNIKDFNYKCCSLREYESTDGKESGTVFLPIYNDDFSPESSYFWAILTYIVSDFDSSLELWYKSFEFGEKVYQKIINYFGIILANRLHKQNIFIFDNKNLTRNEDKYEKLKNNEVFKKIKMYFGDLFSKFLFDPNSVVELVGKDNFRKFALWLIYLAPSLSDYLDLEDEEYEEAKSTEHIEIPYEELDIDIMEVLDDMYLEYLKHQDLALTTINTKVVLQAKESVELKKERAKLENAQDSKYYDITRLFKYLEKYGNCQIRFFSRSKVCELLDFKINENGTLTITKYLELYDKCPYSYDGNFAKKVKLKETIKEFEYKEEDYSLVMAFVLYYSLNKMIKISTNRDLTPSNTTVISKLYDVTYPMCNLDLKDLIEWVKSSSDGQINILLSQNTQSKEIYNFDDIECKVRTLQNKIATIQAYWKKIQNARNEIEYEEATKEWDKLEENSRRK